MKWIGIRKTLTENDVLRVIEELEITLPSDYIRSIGSINGGALKSAYYKDKKLGKIPYSRNINFCSESRVNVAELFKSINGETKKYFPFGSVGNGDYYCFDLSCEVVVLYMHETKEIYPLCNTYTELMESLLIEE